MTASPSSELLLESLNIACFNVMERKSKRKLTQPATTVNVVQSEDKPPNNCPAKETSSEFLSELKEFWSSVASLKNRIAEVGQIKETL